MQSTSPLLSKEEKQLNIFRSQNQVLLQLLFHAPSKALKHVLLKIFCIISKSTGAHQGFC